MVYHTKGKEWKLASRGKDVQCKLLKPLELD